MASGYAALATQEHCGYRASWETAERLKSAREVRVGAARTKRFNGWDQQRRKENRTIRADSAVYSPSGQAHPVDRKKVGGVWRNAFFLKQHEIVFLRW